MTETEALHDVINAADAVILTGQRLRSDPGTHELALAGLCNAMGTLAEITAHKAPIPDDLMVREYPV